MEGRRVQGRRSTRGQPSVPSSVSTTEDSSGYLPLIESEWDAYAEAVLPLQTRLFRSALMLVRDHATAEDLLADTICAVFAPWCRGGVEDLGGYLHRALHNRFNSTARRQGRLLRLTPKLARPVSYTDPDNDERDRQLNALAQLSPRQRSIVVARFYDDLSVADCADLLGVSEGTVKSTCSDALARLRVLLSDALT